MREADTISEEQRTPRWLRWLPALGTIAGFVGVIYFSIAWLGAGIDCGLDQLDAGGGISSPLATDVKTGLAMVIVGPILGWVIAPALVRWRASRRRSSMAVIVGGSVLGLALLEAMGRWDVCG